VRNNGQKKKTFFSKAIYILFGSSDKPDLDKSRVELTEEKIWGCTLENST